MSEKDGKTTSTLGESVADYAKREMAEVAERERRKQVYWENQKRVAAELPARFFALAETIRTEVDTFNQIVDAGRRISFTESAGLAARAEAGRAELNLTFGRKGVEAWVGLAELMRLGRAPTAFIIEAHIKLSRARLRLRAEAIPKGDDDIRYRVTVDGKEIKFGGEARSALPSEGGPEGPHLFIELGSRLVLAVAKDDPLLLDGSPNPI